ncbi:MAG: hypothetical protein FWC83_00140 [Alphaproteobacteria bacterium]|nr:hypothetical protein [Alphaproteobacteria bacterium]
MLNPEQSKRAVKIFRIGSNVALVVIAGIAIPFFSVALVAAATFKSGRKWMEIGVKEILAGENPYRTMLNFKDKVDRARAAKALRTANQKMYQS